MVSYKGVAVNELELSERERKDKDKSRKVERGSSGERILQCDAATEVLRSASAPQ